MVGMNLLIIMTLVLAQSPSTEDLTPREREVCAVELRHLATSIEVKDHGHIAAWQEHVTRCLRRERERVARVEEDRQARQKAAEEGTRALAAAEAAHAKSMELARTPEEQLAVLSAYICWQKQLKAEATEAIAHEKKKAKLVGVVDKVALNDAAEQLIEADKELRASADHLRRHRWRTNSCDKGETAELLECFVADGCAQYGQQLEASWTGIRE